MGRAQKLDAEFVAFSGDAFTHPLQEGLTA
jgi:hypothetical protein